MDTALKGRNLAGIVPIAGRQDLLGLPWPDCLHPLAKDMLAIERAVYECALVNCDSIWVICNDDTAPLIKKRLGDYVINPNIYDNWDFKRHPDSCKEYIPIFYTPILQKHRKRVDTVGWSVLHGALTSFIVSKKISKWTVPTSYYVSFPYGIYDPSALKKVRSAIRGSERVYASYNGKTVRDGLYLPFSFTPECWLHFRRQLNETNTGGDKNLPLEERWSAKNFSLDKIFKHDKIDIDKKVELEFYHNLDSWESLREFYISNKKLKKMPPSMAKPFFIRKEDR